MCQNINAIILSQYEHVTAADANNIIAIYIELTVVHRLLIVDTDIVATLIYHHILKVILYSYLILKKMNERITDS